MLYNITATAVRAQAVGYYAPEQLARWMDGRDAAHYEQVIAGGRVRVAERSGARLGFVDTRPGEITRLFVRPEAAGRGLGRCLLEIGVAEAWTAAGVRLEATLNAAPFYARCGFVETGRALFTHPLGGLPLEIVRMWRNFP
ncbi:MAG: GNAT family N-acetyltransferase [Acidocella sp.]|nr:GNAT family N-acetyltransferase [Acidocella sp.]